MSFLYNKKQTVFYFSFVFICTTILLVFQNCSKMQSISSFSMDPSLSTSQSHPGAEPAKPTLQSPLLANRLYISNLLTDIFVSDALPGSERAAIDAILNKWILSQNGIFGYPCNPNNEIGGGCPDFNLAPHSTGTNTLRAAYKSQACQSLISRDDVLLSGIQKISTAPYTPDINSMTKLYELFYRGDDADPNLMHAIVSVDRYTIAKNPSISTLERWRYLFLAVCESPGWEIL